MNILLGLIFIAWLEINQHPNPACYDKNIAMLPEMCHASFNRH